MSADLIWARIPDASPSTGIGVRIESDPLGPVNHIVSMYRNDRSGSTRIGRSVLYPVRAGQAVRLVRDEGGYRMEDLFALRDTNWHLGEMPALTRRVPGWRVEVDDRTVLSVADAELRTPYVAPPVPLWTRLRRSARKWARSAADGLARRLGYVPEDEAGGDW